MRNISKALNRHDWREAMRGGDVKTSRRRRLAVTAKATYLKTTAP